MNSIKCTIIGMYRIMTLSAMAYVTWKIVHYWQKGFAGKTGHTIDASVSAAAEKIEKTARVVDGVAEGGLGKGLDDVLTDTKKAFEKAGNLVKHAVQRAK